MNDTSLENSKELSLTKVDKSNPVPLYYQLKEIIKGKIDREEWKPSDKIPSEAFLSNYNNISIMTVRQAIKALRAEGVLYKVIGKGIFVSKPRLERDLSELTSFTERLISDGFNVTRHILNIKTIPSDNNVASKLEISEGSTVIRVERLMFYEKTPFYCDINFFPYDLCHSLTREDFSSSSIYPLLENKLGLPLDIANLTLEAIKCKSYQAKLLQVRNGSPVLHLSQVTHLIDGRPIQLLDAIARNDIFKYTLVRRKTK
jgi:GntR family transcriptional regulator